ncbi:MAG TPA: Crp/Fnr family transcriptional regulator [Ideonella sp.]|nr:Crp/Fnr family transcriptional regulator [Ideonella sp.]
MEVRPFDVPRYLSVLPLFNDLSPPELTRLAEGCTLRRLTRGEMVFRTGERCEEFHVVVTGQVKLFVLSPSGHEKVVELISPGQTFGEAIMFTDRPYILSAQSLADTLLLTVSKRAVLEEIARDHRFALRMLAGLSRRLHGLIHDVEAYALHSGLQRVIGYLLRDQPIEDCDEGERRTISLPVSKATIASRLSLTPEYFSRVLHELADQGLIEIDRREIRIVDAPRLARFQLEHA